jgi:hypothetical protein
MILLADLLCPLFPRSSIAYPVCHLIGSGSRTLLRLGSLSEKGELQLDVGFEAGLHLCKFLEGEGWLDQGFARGG